LSCGEVVAPLVLLGWILEDWDAVSSEDGGEEVADPRPLMMKSPNPVEVEPVVAGWISGDRLEVVSSALSVVSSVELLADTAPVLEGVSVSDVLVDSSSVLLLVGTTSDSAVANTVFVSPISVVNLAALRLISVSEPFSVGQWGVCVFVSTTVSSAVTHTSCLSQDTLVDVDVKTVVQAVRTGKAGAQDVIGMSLSCSWTVGKVSR
jgi:hypothetical protein